MVKDKILISGAGIAGLTIAWWLKQYGFDPHLVEIAPTQRKGGYMIDFWGVGYDVAEKMDIIKDLKNVHYNIPKLLFVDKNNKKKGRFNIAKLRKRIDYRHFNLLRSDLEQILYNKVKATIKISYNLSIKQINQRENDVNVQFSDGSSELYNYVIGADGQHSNVRKLLFGAESNFEKFLGYYTASYTIDNFLEDDQIFYSYTIPEKQVGIYSIRESKLATFFIWKSKKYDYNYKDIAKMDQILRKSYEKLEWYTPELLDAIEKAPDFYFDPVSQIILDKWYSNRVVLIGDACQCVSLIAGQGSALAMAGAYILAGELKQAEGNYKKAFKNYEAKMSPEILRKQAMAQDFANTFVPSNKISLWLRNKLSRFVTLPIISKLFIKRFLSDSLTLSDYYLVEKNSPL